MSHERDDTAATYGLLACGSAGSWSVDLDESPDGTDLVLTLDGPALYLTFVPSGVGVVRAARDYLRTYQPAPLELGRFGPAPVTLHWDNEESGRCYLIAPLDARATLRATLSTADTAALADALDQVLDDLPPVPDAEG